MSSVPGPGESVGPRARRWRLSWLVDRPRTFALVAIITFLVMAVAVVKVTPSLLGSAGKLTPTILTTGSSSPPLLAVDPAVTTAPPAAAAAPAPTPAAVTTHRSYGTYVAPAAPIDLAMPNPLVVPASVTLATPIGSIPTYPSPGASAIGAVGAWYGYPLTLPVIGQAPGWLDVRLPWRPNESTAWVEDSQVTLSSSPYWMVLDLATEHLTVYDAGAPILDFPVGIGVPDTPTVTGHYFVAVHETDPPPQYGPFILDTSAHSDAIQSWEGEGDAIIAIHGPITPEADAEIGSTGARVSNGCIRLHDSDLSQLGIIPLGTPLDIYS